MQKISEFIALENHDFEVWRLVVWLKSANETPVIIELLIKTVVTQSSSFGVVHNTMVEQVLKMPCKLWKLLDVQMLGICDLLKRSLVDV